MLAKLEKTQFSHHSTKLDILKILTSSDSHPSVERI